MEKFDELLTLVCESSISNIAELQKDLFELKKSFDENRHSVNIRGMKRDLKKFGKVVDEIDSEIESLKKDMVGDKLNTVSTIVKRVGLVLAVVGKISSTIINVNSTTKSENLIQGTVDAYKAHLGGKDAPESYLKAKKEYDMIQKAQTIASASYVAGTTASVGGELAQKSIDAVNSIAVGTTYRQLKYVTAQIHSMLKSMEKTMDSVEKDLSKIGRKKMTESVSEALMDSVLSGEISNDKVLSVLSVYK